MVGNVMNYDLEMVLAVQRIAEALEFFKAAFIVYIVLTVISATIAK